MDRKDLRQIIISAAAYSLSSIIGPLVFLLLPAYFLDNWLGTKPVIMLVAVLLAFIVTNILLYRKISKINHLITTKFTQPHSKIQLNEDELGKKVDRESSKVD